MDRKADAKTNRAASVALLAGGLWFVGLGLYFIALRPALLPEDVRFIGSSAEAIAQRLPRLAKWLGHVFSVLGGFVLTLGALVCWHAVGTLRLGGTVGTHVLAIAGLAAMGWMVIVNFMLASDFRWLLAVSLLPWLLAIWLSAPTIYTSGAPGR